MIAVTGANGLIGNFIVKKLVAEGLPVVALTRQNSDVELLSGVGNKLIRREADVLDVPALMEALAEVDTVIHAAGMVSFNPRHTKRVFEVNVEGTKNVVNACLAMGIPKLIHISTVAALGRVKGVSDIDEDSKWIASALNSDYAESKYMAELEIHRGMEEGLDVALINPSVVLAPADWYKSSAQLFRYSWQQRPFYPQGSLNYVDVRDVAEMVFRIYSSGLNGQKFIASAGVISFHDFFKEVGKRFHRKPPSIKITGTWMHLLAKAEAIRCRLSGSEPMITPQSATMASETFFYNHQKAMRILGINFHPLEETLDWCCDHYMAKVTTNK